ncbi:MAG: tetratricopeptide repeat protein, partial [Deltaproteobacteria bacterium]|nr:tetratricopeptide repeat protein [Deltaproteobacteria bacterium]
MKIHTPIAILNVAAILATVLATTATAAADSRTDQADALFRQGRAHAAAGRLAEACAAFDDSQQLAPATTTLFNQADCREKNRQLATASRLFAQAER